MLIAKTSPIVSSLSSGIYVFVIMISQSDLHEQRRHRKISWFKHILFMAEHNKGLGRADKICLALSKIICFGLVFQPPEFVTAKKLIFNGCIIYVSSVHVEQFPD